MDLKQLFNDIIHFNVSSFVKRWHKLVAVVKRALFLPILPNRGKRKDLKQTPVIINNRNRLTYLKQLINWLETNGYSNIYIIDNASTYPPLLEYYNTTKHRVFRLNENVGHLSLWKTGIYKQFQNEYYVYTDPDVVPAESCPANVLEFFMTQLDKHPEIEKIGFGLKIDDLPDHYAEKQRVIDWESKYWTRKVEQDIYDAELDTTFALYRPYTIGSIWVQRAYRSGGNYVARHLPWYENSSAVTEEDKYYKEHVRVGASHWIPANK